MSPADLLPPGLSAVDAVTVMAALAAGLVVFAIWYGLVERDVTAGRIRDLARRRAALVTGLTANGGNQYRRRLVGLNWMNRVVATLKLKRGEKAAEIAARLAQAGWRSPEGVTVYLFFKLVLPAGLALGAALVFVGLGAFDLTPMARLLVCGGAAFLGFAGPDIFLKNQTTKRREAIRKALPDTLDLLVICAEAGLSLDAALKRSARELARSTPEIADELELTSIELGFLPERHQALENLNRRTNLPAVRSVVNALSQAERYGTPLAQSLRVLASEYRSERMLKAEEKASRLPATMTIPLIFFVLPPLFVVLLGPGLLRIIDGLSKL